VVGYAVGREIMKHLTRSEGQPASLEELEDALVSSGLAESLKFELEDDGSVTVTLEAAWSARRGLAATSSRRPPARGEECSPT